MKFSFITTLLALVPYHIKAEDNYVVQHQQFINNILRNYDKRVIPKPNVGIKVYFISSEKVDEVYFQSSKALDVTVGLSLQEIIEVDTQKNTLKTNIWINYGWTDFRLGKSKSNIGTVDDIDLVFPLLRVF